MEQFLPAFLFQKTHIARIPLVGEERVIGSEKHLVRHALRHESVNLFGVKQRHGCQIVIDAGKSLFDLRHKFVETAATPEMRQNRYKRWVSFDKGHKFLKIHFGLTMVR